MKSKFIMSAAAGVAAVLALAGCGGAQPAANGQVTLKMVESLTNPTRTAVKKLIADFEKQNPKIKVNLISPPTDQADQKIQQMLQSGKGLDTLEVRDITVGPWATNGWLYDMSKDLKGWNGWKDITENAAKSSKDAKGRTYFVPYGFYGLSLFYRTDLIKEAGFGKPPATWDELLSRRAPPTTPRSGGTATRSAAGPTPTATSPPSSRRTSPTRSTANGYKLTNGKHDLLRTRGPRRLKTYLKLFKKASPPSSVAWGYPEMVEGFSNGSTAFLLQDPEVIATVRQSKSITKDQWTTAPLLAGPSGKAVQPLATAGWGIAKGSKHKAEAVKLIKFLSQGEASTTFTKENSLVPILKRRARTRSTRPARGRATSR